MSNQPSPFEILICDLNCALTASEFSYKSHHLRLTLLVLAQRGDPSERNIWFSRPCPAPLAIRLLEEAESRSFTCKLSPPRDVWELRHKVRGILQAYVQRRIGLALLAHRAAWPIVYEAGGLSDSYGNAGYQLQLLALKFHPSIAEIRRAERFAKFVRLSAYHALMAKDLETCH